jgi:hypothetical protein
MPFAYMYTYLYAFSTLTQVGKFLLYFSGGLGTGRS